MLDAEAIDDLIKMIDQGDRLPTPDEAEIIIEALVFYKEMN